VFGSQFEPLEQGRNNLLLDVRYVGDTGVSRQTRRALRALFHDHDIHVQWLEYPHRYDRTRFEATYGWQTKSVLWGQESFYRREIERQLRDIAIQIVVVPGYVRPDDDRTPHSEGVVESPLMRVAGGKMGGYVNGFSLGNRAIVAERSTHRAEFALLLHEIAHLALCHDQDPSNTGVMGTAERVGLLDHEWERLRQNLDNVNDTTGYDVLARPCLWEGCLSGALSTIGR
jgi:hypothetical protein